MFKGQRDGGEAWRIMSWPEYWALSLKPGRWKEPETAEAAAGPHGPPGNTDWKVFSCRQSNPASFPAIL